MENQDKRVWEVVGFRAKQVISIFGKFTYRRMVKSFITDIRRSICEQAMDKIRFKGNNTSKWFSSRYLRKELVPLFHIKKSKKEKGYLYFIKVMI